MAGGHLNSSLLSFSLSEKGRAFFRVPGRFETSLIMTGAHEDDIWAFVSVEFLFNIPNGENKGIKGLSQRHLDLFGTWWWTYTDGPSAPEFPRFPPKAYRDQLAFQVVDIISPPAIPEQPLASAVVDAPLIRVYNFLRECSKRRGRRNRGLINTTELLSMHYLLEVLLYQVQMESHCGFLIAYIDRLVNSRTMDGINESISERHVTERSSVLPIGCVYLCHYKTV
jgi:hypothetical protein